MAGNQRTQIRGTQIKDESIEDVDIASGSIRETELHESVIYGQPSLGSANADNDRLLIWDADGSTTGSLKQIAPANLGVTASPAGSDTQIQYNNGGSTGGASKVLYDDSNHRLGIGSTNAPSNTLTVHADAANAYVALIDNDAGSAGHGLKVTSDGTGTGTNIFDVESASTTVFRVRGDGRVGIGKVSSLPEAVLTVSSSNADGDIAIAHKIQHIGDDDTHIQFTDDMIQLTAGGRTFIKLEESSQDKLIINHGALDIDLKVGGENDANLIRTDAANDSVYFGGADAAGVDNNFWVSGSIGSKGTVTRGTTVFGGDTVISGSLHVNGGNTFGGASAAAIILDSTTTSKIVWDSQDDGNSPDAAIYESGGSLYLSSSSDVRIYAGTDDILLYPRDMLQIIEDENASGNFASFFAQPTENTYYNVLDVGDAGVTINDDSRADYDFRVESDSNTHMLFVDSGNNTVGINDSTPTSTLTVGGSLALTVLNINAANDPGTTYTITETNCVILVNTRPTAEGGIDSAITLTLPDASDNPGMITTVKDAAGYSNINRIFVVPAGSDKIDGVIDSFQIPTIGGWARFISDGVASWAQIG